MITVSEKDAAEKAKAVRAGELPGPARTLAEALARVYADGGAYVQKTGRMEAGPARYRYAKEGDFIAAVRPLMEVHGVTIRPIEMRVVTNEVFQRKSGGDAYRVVVLVTYELLHSSGDRATVQAFGEGQDSGDKAFNKAMTGAMKYALRQSFCVETGDDPDDTPSHAQERAPQADNHPLRARYAMRLGQCKSRDEYLGICAEVAADVKAGKLTEADRLALAPVAKETSGRFPEASRA